MSGLAVSETNQAEHAHIHSALDLEQVDQNLYRSRSLWKPFGGRGVFGGSCYFLASAKASQRIIYYVERLREGKSYSTRAVKALQDGHVIFILICSFQRPEPWQPQYQWQMPKVPPPSEFLYEEDRLQKIIDSDEFKDNQRARDFFKVWQYERVRSPIAVKLVKESEALDDGSIRFMYYMRAKNLPSAGNEAYPVAFQKCILSYLSDLYFVGVAPRTLGFERFSKGPNATGMVSSLDHTIHFFSDSLDCGEWLLYVGSGRAVVRGQMFSQDGSLVAVLSQEGVVRADIRGPEPPAANAKL
ncbi:HotDog domain-containing protein [Flagelloscypha sp. PMI_526]|nr:HotDog domain-containing protein [Flagelloscypha sp. PMI_526]